MSNAFELNMAVLPGGVPISHVRALESISWRSGCCRRRSMCELLQKYTVFSLHVRSLSSPEISQRASSSSFTLQPPAHCATPAPSVRSRHGRLQTSPGMGLTITPGRTAQIRECVFQPFGQ